MKNHLYSASFKLIDFRFFFSGALAAKSEMSYVLELNLNCFILFFQEMENKIRSTLYEIYFGKTKDIVNGLRSTTLLADMKKQIQLNDEIKSALSRRPTHQ